MTTAPTPSPTSTGARIEIAGLTKSFGDFRAVDDLSFVVEPGRVTGFLGPNGAGKTTTLRMLLGLIRPSAGSATIDGRPYAELDNPMQVVGSALEATSFHPGRTGRDHLRVLAAASRVPDARVDELLELVGIAAAAGKRAGTYSMGMRQRLGLAAALLGDPRVLILDEPANGLDPEGIRWLRGFLRHLSTEGKTILVSSHLLNEVEQTVDDVVIIANGRLVQQGPISTLHGDRRQLVRTTDPDRLGAALGEDGLLVVRTGDDSLEVTSEDARRIGDTALRLGLPIYELRESRSDLEDLFFQLTSAPENRNRNLGATEPTTDVQPGEVQ
ncbi:ABC transporter ATP-binding protein [Luteipulveratus flavus]|uniref:ABC transporter ATP-binding protein n=1 Tax=Luteipulveratus flavus TaxID=3031728 RepID=A0ABT6C839_9MICO|nr:ABC transporter ATP-binding protein [Luteipulveratus sp. YIM 133296]MDF8265096.1 ABC transporter ATP-binding protein [Luteipulveratus sp. YIM 133296]